MGDKAGLGGDPGGSPVRNKRTLRYFHVTEGGHDWYLNSTASNFEGVWCDSCKDFHRAAEVDPLTMPESAQRAFLARVR